MKSIKISPIHLGRYRIEVIGDDDEYRCVDGGSAYVMMFLNEMIFKPEHYQYIGDQRRLSDELNREALGKMQQKLIKSRMQPPTRE